MAQNIAAEIEKEYGQPAFTDPSIKFGYNKIEIQQKLNIFGKAVLILCLLFPVTFLLFYDLPAPTIFIIAFVLFNINILYEFHRRWDLITINFETKEITIENRFWLINSIRKFLATRTNISFEHIIYFIIDDGRRLFNFTDNYSLSARRTTLFVKPAHKTGIELAHFRFERDATRLGGLLQHYIVGRPVQLANMSNVSN